MSTYNNISTGVSKIRLISPIGDLVQRRRNESKRLLLLMLMMLLMLALANKAPEW